MIVSQMMTAMSISKSINHSVSPGGGVVPSTTFTLAKEVIILTINVTVRNGNLEQAMRVLKRKVQKEGLVKELRERQFYKKPSEIKQEKKKEAIKNWKKKQKKLEKIRGF